MSEIPWWVTALECVPSQASEVPFENYCCVHSNVFRECFGSQLRSWKRESSKTHQNKKILNLIYGHDLFFVQKSTFLLFLYLAPIFVEMCIFLKLFFQKIVFDGGKSFSGAHLSYNLDSEMLLGVRKLIMIHRPQELTRCSCFALFFGSGIKIHSQDPLRKGCSTGFQICHFGRNFYQCRWKMENEKRLRVLRASRFLFSKARSMVK